MERHTINTGDSMEATRKFPYDFDSLNKGSIIEAKELTEIFELKPSEKAYSFALMGLANQIEKYFKQASNQTVTVRRLGDDLHICTDEVASEVNQKRFNRDLRALLRDHDRLMGVDMTQLSHDRLRGHQRAIVNQSRVIQAVNGSMKRRSITAVAPEQAAVAPSS